MKNKFVSTLRIKFLELMGNLGVLCYSDNIVHKGVHCVTVASSMVVLYCGWWFVGIGYIMLILCIQYNMCVNTRKCVRCGEWLPLHMCAYLPNDRDQPYCTSCHIHVTKTFINADPCTFSQMTH